MHRKTIKHVSGMKITVTIKGEQLSEADQEFIRTFVSPIYFNDRTAQHWMFDEKMPSGRWLENIRPENTLKTAKALVC